MWRKIRGKAIKLASSKEHYPHPFPELYLKSQERELVNFCLV